MKNKKGFLISLAIVISTILIGIYIGYKLFFLSYYNDKNLEYSFKSISEAYKISKNINIKTEYLANNNYLEFQDIKIRNDFLDYAKEVKSDVTGDYVVLTKADDKLSFTIGVTEPYIEYMHLTDDHLENGKNPINEKVDIKDVNSYLKKHHITSDIDLFNFIASDNYHYNFFTSVKDMKGVYGIYSIAMILNPLNKEIVTINGDINGYMFIENTLDNNIREVNLIKNDKRYVLTFIGKAFTEDKVNDLLKTIIIEDNN